MSKMADIEMGVEEDASGAGGSGIGSALPGGSGVGASMGQSPLPSGSGAGSVVSGSGIYGSGVSGDMSVGHIEGSAVGGDNDDVDGDEEMGDGADEDGDIEHEKIEPGDSVSDRQRNKIKVCFRKFITDFVDSETMVDPQAAGKEGADKKEGGKNLNRAERDADEKFKYRHRLKKMCQEKEYIFYVSFKDVWSSFPNLAYWLCEIPQEILPILNEVVSA